ncbi:MAG: hypothetical protein K5765_07115 [Clostridia bacterium]|nr:hypothetical protein [Clostridia bacterium]
MCKKAYIGFMSIIAKMIFKKPEVIYEEMPEENEVGIYCPNHGQANGPAMLTLWFDRPHDTWMVHYVLEKELAPNFIYHDFFSGDSKKHKKSWRMLSWIVAKALRPLLDLGNPIPVYHDEERRDIPFNMSMETLDQGRNVVLFAESPKKYSQFVNTMYTGFTRLGKLYYEHCGKCIKFYPMYVENKLHKMVISKPIQYNPEWSEEDAKKIISEYVRDNIDRVARSLPEHEGVPFLADEWYDVNTENVNNMKQYWSKFEVEQSEEKDNENKEEKKEEN